MRGWNTWLPEQVRAAAAEAEPRSFNALSRTIEAEWRRSRPLGDAGRMLPWVSTVKLYAGTKERFDAADVQRVIEVALDIVLQSTGDDVSQIRWASCASKLLRKYRRELRMEIAWRPLHKAVHDSFLRLPARGFRGPPVDESHKQAMLELVHKARRFFPAGSAAEIWAEFAPGLQDVHCEEAYWSLGWLSLLLPTCAAAALDGDWAAWVPEWLRLWGQVVHNSYWNNLWMGLLARLAKHDTAGAVPWARHLDELFTRFLWSFSVPVGTSSAKPPVSRQTPQECEGLFGIERSPLQCSCAKAIVFLLSAPAPSAELSVSGAAACEPPGEGAMARLERMADMLENYFHPSNGGQWTSSLSHWLHFLMEYYVDHHTPSLLAGEAAAGGCASPQRALPGPLERRFVATVVRLATKAQFSKNTSMMETACDVLRRAAHVAPGLVLPLVSSRFVMALESVTASHMLATSIHTLALCVRPLLRHGLGTEEGSASVPLSGLEMPDLGRASWSRQAGQEVITMAMAATLPGIDANDPPKTMACFRLYCNVLSSMDVFGPGGPCSEEWVDELLSRIFAMLSNLDSAPGDASSGPSSRSRSQSSFLLMSSSMFRPMLELLFARLPAGAQAAAVRHVSRFLETSTLPGVTTEAGVLCDAVTRANPEMAAAEILRPTLAALLDDLQSVGSADHHHLTVAAAGALTWRFGLVSSALHHMGPHLLPHADPLQHAIDQGLSLTSCPAVQEAAARALSSAACTCLDFFILDQHAVSAEDYDSSGIEEWLSKPGPSASRAPRWHVPSAEEVRLAGELVEKYLRGSIAEMRTLCRTASASPAGPCTRQEGDDLHRLAISIEGILSGVQSCLPDFQWHQQAGTDARGLSSQPLVVVGSMGVALDLPGLREDLGEALVAAFAWLSGRGNGRQHEDLLRVLDLTIGVGSREFSNTQQSMSAWINDADSLCELWPEPSRPGLRRRRPRWLALERTSLHGIWRASQALYRPWLSTCAVEPELHAVPKVYAELFRVALCNATNSYKNARAAAVMILERAMKRVPCLAPVAAAQMIASLAAVPEALAGACSFSTDAAMSVQDRLSRAADLVDRTLSLEAALAGRATEPDGTTLADAQAREAHAVGACAVLRGQACWRFTRRSPPAFAALVRGMCSALRHDSDSAQRALTELFFITSLRFVCPPAAAFGQSSSRAEAGGAGAILALVEELLGCEPVKSSQMHWRAALMVDSLLLFLLPAMTPSVAGSCCAEFLRSAASGILPVRQVALMAIAHLLATAQAATADDPLRLETTAAVREAFGQPGYAGALLAKLAYNHVSLHDAEGGGGSQHSSWASSSSREAVLIKSISGTLVRSREWPVGRKRPAAVRAGQFVVLHARSIEAVSAACPEVCCEAFREPLRDATQEQSHTGEKSHVSAAAEIIAALLASGAAFAPGPDGSTPWSAWMRGLLRECVAASPLELADMWGLVVRYGVGGLCAREDTASLSVLLESLLTELPAAQASSGAAIKRLKCFGHCLIEMLSRGCCRWAACEAFQAAVLRELPEMEGHLTSHVRREVARCMVILSTRSMGGTARTDAAVAELRRRLVENLRSGVAYISANFGAPGNGQAAVHAPEDGEIDLAAESGDTAMGEAAGAVDAVLARLDCSVQFVGYCMRSGDAVQLTGTLLSSLPHLLKLQELSDPELQQLSMEAKKALALLKYLPVRLDFVAPAVGTIERTQGFEPWHARAAALVFLQYFWFRQVFLLGELEAQKVLSTVVSLLGDSKTEVRELAAKSLSGILRCIPHSASTELRASFMGHAESLRHERRSRGSRPSLRQPEAIAARHAPVLGLEAFVLSSPYDVPQWLPDVLMCIASMANEPPPLKTTVTRALSEFKRTHEEAGLHECRELFTEEQWDAIQDVSSCSSYFA